MNDIAEFLIKNKISFNYQDRTSHDIIFCGFVGCEQLKKLIKLCDGIEGVKYCVNPEGFVITKHEIKTDDTNSAEKAPK